MMGEEHDGLSPGASLDYKDNNKNKETDEKILNGGHFLNNSASFTTNLTHLKLCDCDLNQFPSDISNSDSIIEIDLSKNSLQDLPDSFINFKKLRTLNLSNNCISKIPSAFYNGLFLLKNLNLSRNNLVTFQKAPCCVAILSELDLSWNRLLTPPPWLIESIPSSLETLDLSANPCFQLCPLSPQLPRHSPSTITKVADKIRTLKLNSCGFRGGTNERYLANFRNLAQLELGNICSRRELENCIPDLSELPGGINQLILRNAALACLPKAITNLLNLTYLDVSKNDIHWFPPGVERLQKLVVLHAESSRIYLLPPEMNLLPALKELYLSNNEMSSSDGFEELATLEVLDLYGNQFITVPDLEKLCRLRALDFCQNYIEPPKLITLGKRVCSYESLRDCLRSKHCNERGRANGAKDFPVVPESDDNCSEAAKSISDFEDYVDAEDGGNNGDLESPEEAEGEEVREVWDTDSDENYDPNTTLRTAWKRSCESLTGELPYELQLHPHFFAPFRATTPVTLSRQELPAPVEGQFDDSLQ